METLQISGIWDVKEKKHACGRCERTNHRNSKNSACQEHPRYDREQRVLYLHGTTQISCVIYRIFCYKPS